MYLSQIFTHCVLGVYSLMHGLKTVEWPIVVDDECAAGNALLDIAHLRYPKVCGHTTVWCLGNR